MIYKCAIEALQKAILARLQSVLTVPVYDDVPDNPAFPYVVIGDDTESLDPRTKQKVLTSHTHTIHIYSRFAGVSECVNLIDDISQAFDDALDMSADGFAEVELIPSDRSVTREYDDAGAVYRHGTVIVRATIEQL